MQIYLHLCSTTEVDAWISHSSAYIILYNQYFCENLFMKSKWKYHFWYHGNSRVQYYFDLRQNYFSEYITFLLVGTDFTCIVPSKIKISNDQYLIIFPFRLSKNRVLKRIFSKKRVSIWLWKQKIELAFIIIQKTRVSWMVRTVRKLKQKIHLHEEYLRNIIFYNWEVFDSF